MTSRKQIEANRQNAQKSTGPRTSAGKVASSANALKHGLTAAIALIDGEDADAFESLVDQLKEEFQPMSNFEERLVEQVATHWWRLRRVYRIEAGLFTWLRSQQEHEVAQKDWDMAHERFRAKAQEPQAPKQDSPPLWQIQRAVNPDAYDRISKHSKLLNEDRTTVAGAYAWDLRGDDAIRKLSRYEVGIERSLYRAVHELHRLQAARQGREAAVPVAVDVAVEMSPAPAEGDS